MIYCPVCKTGCSAIAIETDPNRAKRMVHYKGELYYPCCPLCQTEFERNPEKYAGKAKSKKRKSTISG